MMRFIRENKAAVLGVILGFLCIVLVCVIVQNHFLVSDPVSRKIVRKCPYDFEVEPMWTTYSNDNMAGLVAVATLHTSSENTMIYVFDANAGSDEIKALIKNDDTIEVNYTSESETPSFLKQEKEVKKRSNFYYVRVTCDNRISLSDVCFTAGENNLQRKLYVIIGLEGEATLKYFPDKGTGREGYYIGQQYTSYISGWSTPGYSEVAKDVL